MAAGSLSFALDGSIAFYFGVTLCGFGFGTCYPTLVLVCGDIWGAERFASNYMVFDGSPGAVGGFIFGVWITQAVYNAHADPDGRCHGKECFFLTYLLIAVLQLVGMLLVVRVSMKCRDVYRIISGQTVRSIFETSGDIVSLQPSSHDQAVKMLGTFQCPECWQKFDTEKAKQLHWKFIHDPNRHQED